MGRLAADSGLGSAAWSRLHPAQKLIQSCLLGVVAAVLGAYGLSGFVYGYLHFFVLEGFAQLHGGSALALSAGSLAWACGLATHLVQRHWRGASVPWCAWVRKRAFWSGAVLWAAALLIEVLVGLRLGRAGQPVAIAPDAQWFLAPLPWVWRAFIGFAADRVVGRLIVVGLASLLLGCLCLQKAAFARAGMVGLGLASGCLGAYFLGDAAYQYASGRGLLKNVLGVAELGKELARNPGSYNAWTFVCWWGGWAFIAMGSLAVAAGLLMPGRLLRHGH